MANRWINLPALTTLKSVDEASDSCHCLAPMAPDRDFFPPVMPAVTEAEVARRLHKATAHPHLSAQLATALFTAASTTQLDTAHVGDLGPDGTTITLHDHGLRQGCTTHPVPAWARPLLRAAAYAWSIETGMNGPLFSDPWGSTGQPYLTAFAESCARPSHHAPSIAVQKNATTQSPQQAETTIWPVCTAHYRTAWATAEPDLMRGCPYPPPHTRKTIDRRKKGWLPPDYGLRHLR
ncbi:hypothetical protein ACIRO3_30130 [Streptomyces sp. NPDC102278]|uniref:hypothetical protein n=1 Tax=Streptomyces sp. NPDC102278 TaxID=3366152 RepID=UPI00380E34F7